MEHAAAAMAHAEEVTALRNQLMAVQNEEKSRYSQQREKDRAQFSELEKMHADEVRRLADQRANIEKLHESRTARLHAQVANLENDVASAKEGAKEHREAWARKEELYKKERARLLSTLKVLEFRLDRNERYGGSGKGGGSGGFGSRVRGSDLAAALAEVDGDIDETAAMERAIRPDYATRRFETSAPASGPRLDPGRFRETEPDWDATAATGDPMMSVEEQALAYSYEKTHVALNNSKLRDRLVRERRLYGRAPAEGLVASGRADPGAVMPKFVTGGGGKIAGYDPTVAAGSRDPRSRSRSRSRTSRRRQRSGRRKAKSASRDLFVAPPPPTEDFETNAKYVDAYVRYSNSRTRVVFSQGLIQRVDASNR